MSGEHLPIATIANDPKIGIINLSWKGWKEALLEKAFMEKCCATIKYLESLYQLLLIQTGKLLTLFIEFVVTNSKRDDN